MNVMKTLKLSLSLVGVYFVFLGIGYVVKAPAPSLDAKEKMDLSFLRMIRPSELNERERKKPKTPPKVEKQPEVPKPRVAKIAKPKSQNLKMEANPMDLSLDLGNGPYVGAVGASTGAADSDMIPIVKVQPQYPRQAAMKGQEGYVRLLLDINTDGTVTNVRVVESNPRRVFDRSAVQAASKYRYKPPIVDGKPQSIKSHGVQIDFNLDGM